MVLTGPADLAAGLGVWVVGLGGLEPPTSSLSVLGKHEVPGCEPGISGSHSASRRPHVWRRCCHFCCHPSGHGRAEVAHGATTISTELSRVKKHMMRLTPSTWTRSVAIWVSTRASCTHEGRSQWHAYGT
jgi:hypothetical protein